MDMKKHRQTDNGQWMEEVKRKLENYSEPLPASGWERLEKDLATRRSVPQASSGRIFHLRKWTMAAAAALLAGISGISLWFLQSPLSDEVGNVGVPQLALQPSVQESHPVAVTLLKPTEKEDVPSEPRQRPVTARLVAQVERLVQTDEAGKVGTDPVVADVRDEAAPIEEDRKEGIGQVETTSREEKKRSLKPTRPSSRDMLQLPAGESKRKDVSRWSVGLSVGNAGGSGNSLYAGNAYLSDYAYMADNSLDLSSTANGILAIPGDQELVFKEGLPYLLSRGRQIASADHKLPVSVGLSVRKHLWGPFSVETGLTYTYLASDIKFEGSTEKVEQKLHYVGIPLRLNWNFIDRKPFIMYLSAGGAMEKCVYGKLGDEDQTVKPLQFSLAGAVGVQVNAGKHVGIYMEPGLSYFFDDGSSVETIRKETPFNFTLQAGIRLIY